MSSDFLRGLARSMAFLLALPAIAPVAVSAATAPAMARPHVVVYLSDDHGVDFVGCYGNQAIRTPSIDALAKQGVRMARMLAASPTCAPSRSVLYTGLYPARNGAMGNHTATRPDITALPTYLKGLGYRVVLANKVHVKPRKVFDFEYLKATLPRRPDRPRRYRAEGLDVDAVERLLASHAQQRPRRPLCLILADNSPHVIWEKNRTYDPAALPIPPFMVDTPTTRRALANYYQDITTMDQRIGRVLESLDRHGYRADTLFVYTTDQGPEWPHCKWTVYDTGIRVPFVARWPGKIAPKSVCDAMISFVDFTPTLIDVAGGTVPGGLDGRSFRDVLLGRRHDFRDYIFASHTGDGQMNVFPQRAARDGRYKYVLNLKPQNTWTTHFTLVPGILDSHKAVWDTWIDRARGDRAAARLLEVIQHHPAQELYDTQSDPYELDNLAEKPEMKPQLEKLRRRLKQWRARTGDLPGAQP